MSKYQAACKCGWHSDTCETEKRAEVLGDIHETALSLRRAYAHDTRVERAS